ncbi:hypothetical protein [Tuberibacillus sp. Marseille-P3662]|uniref:hypothetical protein n=1 Tax=Tuberibacillus sp. Marseille-P3662 TaxID=1965358 RepID=UPI0015937739|nr:hypothetical protein [Tuberibacillus sp. Marseille-P3662]
MRNNWIPVVASVGIGAVTYCMMNRNAGATVMRQARDRFQHMRQSGEVFPNI